MYQMDPVTFVSNFTLGGAEPWKAHPFLIRAGGHFWSAASSGYMFVGLRQPGANPCRDVPIKKLTKFILTPARHGAELDLALLREWVGTPPSGMVPHGDVENGQQVALLGITLDRRKLAWFLKHLKEVHKIYVWDTTVLLSVKSLGFEWQGGNGRALIAGIDRPPDEDDDVFEIPRTSQEDALDLMLSLPDE